MIVVGFMCEVVLNSSRGRGSGDRSWDAIGQAGPHLPRPHGSTGIVGNFAGGAQVWQREDARVSFTEAGLGDAAGEELFTRNLVRF